MPTGNAAIRKANKATAVELAVSVPALYQADGRQFRISVRTAKDLSEHERAQIWELFEENMYTLYVDSSFGWTPRSKKQEMFDARSRFIIASQEDALTPNPPDIVAYTIFRFDREERQDVVYCYELQVSKSARHCGLGKLLTQKLSDIGATWGMEKVMLTVFKDNQLALSFYRSVGFSIDEISPDHLANSEEGASHNTDYSILSIPIL
ncbi:acyl-CoA N-acyltransferase [Pisolithus orientalis]|uniref:acyl-CoA N-acyltransferase n=1 Tax=Pisolithus orientalis TaxID=936130 RepID=UPI002224E4A2|nr:acyl-CoA N-acyltransferase [Pisolithus orientalis]KAI6005314.1 acyl-CoA N-acyltransferase [Pisolithus orientalis]